MQRMPPSSLRPKKRLAPRCAHSGSITPTRPSLARKATSSSPRTCTRIGALSGSAISRESATGSQNRRKYSPIAVPAPVRVRSSLSAALSILAPRKRRACLAERGITAALAVETVELRPAQALRLEAVDAHKLLVLVVADHLDGSRHAYVEFFPLGADRRISLGH